jgi:hypothetical protein
MPRPLIHLSPNQPDSADAVADRTIRYQTMLARLYVQALLADEYVADQVWELWNTGVITDEVAAWAW